MMLYVLTIITLFFDGLLTNYLPFIPNTLTLFNPLFTITLIFFLPEFFNHEEKKFYMFLGILGFIYDILFTNLLFVHVFIFMFLGFISKYLKKKIDVNYITIILHIIILIFIYELLFGLLVFMFNLVPINFSKILYVFSHSIILNIIYAEIIFIILKKFKKKIKKRVN